MAAPFCHPGEHDYQPLARQEWYECSRCHDQIRLREVDAAQSPYELFGYREEVMTPVGDTFKFYGFRRVIDPGNRRCGSPGQIEVTLTHNIEVITNSGKAMTVKASRKKPVKIVTMLQLMCGRLKTHRVELAKQDFFAKQTVPDSEPHSEPLMQTAPEPQTHLGATPAEENQESES